jgi:hypothetical protein
MFNIRFKNLFIFLFLLTSLTLTYGCSKISSLYGNPSGGEMKSLVLNLTKNDARNISNVAFREFKITKEFKSKKNNEEWYCIETNYQYEYDYNVINGNGSLADKTEHYSSRKDNARFCFTKRENKWYGVKEWVI